MNSNTVKARIARYIAVPVVLGGAALGLAGMANAATTQPADPGFSAPSVKAHPAPEAVPGMRWHTGMHHIATLQPTAIH
jgi:hypothetical protein